MTPLDSALLAFRQQCTLADYAENHGANHRSLAWHWQAVADCAKHLAELHRELADPLPQWSRDMTQAVAVPEAKNSDFTSLSPVADPVDVKASD